MEIFKALIFISILAFCKCDCALNDCDFIDSNQSPKIPSNKKEAESQLAAQIITLLDYYKQDDPVGIPGSIVPDPVLVPDTNHVIGIGHTLQMTNALAYGVSKFRIRSLTLDIARLTVKAEIQLDGLQIIGNYTLYSLFSSTNGPFNVTAKNIVAIGNASIAVERDGKIRTQDIAMDMHFSSLSTNFENLGLMGAIFQSFINSAPNMVFETMKPYMLQEAYEKLRREIDTNIEHLMGNVILPNSISPLDIAIGEGRRRVREMGFDPLIIRNVNHTIGLFTIQLKNTWIHGVSGFHRIDDIFLNLSNRTITAGFNLGTQEIEGFTNWEVSAGRGILTRTGYIKFVIEFIRISIMLSQTLDTRNRPQLLDLHLEIGNIQIQSGGAGTIDYVIEFAINIIPNLLRYQIMEAIEYPIRNKIQYELNKINVERMIKKNIPVLEKMRQKKAFNLNEWKI